MYLTSQRFKSIIVDLSNNKSTYTHSQQLAILADLYQEFVLGKTIVDLFKIYTRKVTYVKAIDRLILEDIIKVLYINKNVNFSIYKDIINNNEKPQTILNINIPQSNIVYTTTTEFAALIRSLGVDNVIELFTMLTCIQYDSI